MSRLVAPGTRLVPSKSRIAGATSQTSNVNARGSVAPGARSLIPPGASRLARPTISKKSSFSVIVAPDKNVKLPGAQFDMALNRSKVQIPSAPGVKADAIADIREIKGPKGVHAMAIGVAKEVAPNASRITRVGLGKLKGPRFQGEFQAVQQKYKSADVVGTKGIKVVRETAPNVVKESTKSYGVRTEMRVPSGTTGTSRLASIRPASSKTSASGLRQPAAVGQVSTKKEQRPSALKKPSKLKPKTESAIKKFDRLVSEELKRRHDPANVLVGATTSDVNLLEAVDHLVRAEAVDNFAGTVRAAEEAAASVPPELAEEAAVAAAKDYQTKLTHVAKEVISGEKPIQVIGYIGITKPKKPVR
ncbi:hypothetical protein CBL_04009 [Carabus blaptoides fortunei]